MNDYPPHFERMPGVTSIERGKYCVTLHETSWGIEVEEDESVSRPLTMATSRDNGSIHVTKKFYDERDIKDKWSVLTVALFELEPGYVVKRLRQLEGEEVLRQEMET